MIQQYKIECDPLTEQNFRKFLREKVMSDEKKPPNLDVKDILQQVKSVLEKTINVCVVAAGCAESSDHTDNPEWHIVRDALDECTDILREVEGKLNG